MSYKEPYTGKEFKPLPMIEPLVGKYINLSKRGISKEYCEKWKCQFLDNYLGEPALAFEYQKEGVLAGYHIKPVSKKCKLVGDIKNCDMYGSWLHGDPTNKTLVITEGHEDAIVCNIVVGDAGYAFTSLPYGNSSVSDFITKHFSLLNRYSSITLCFDSDNAGSVAVNSFLTKFNVIGKIKIAKLSLKDANEMHLAGRDNDLKWAIIKAETYKPKQIVDLGDLEDAILLKPMSGRLWPWRGMDNITHGFYPGKTYCIGSATSVGKTTFIKDIVFDFIERDPRISVGLFFLEQKPVEVIHKLLSSKVNHDLEQPDNPWWDKDRIKLELDGIKTHIHLFDPTLGIELQEIINSIYYFVNINKVQAVIIDNLTILSENRMIDGKRVSEMEYLNEVAKAFNRLKRELNVSFFIICHLSQDKISKTAYVTTSPKNEKKYLDSTAEDINQYVNRSGLTWETGRMPSIENLYGGATVAKLADYVIVLARDTTSSDDVTFRTTHVKFLKTRLRKRGANITFKLIYDLNSGRLKELV